jgi:chromosome segregation ATPase
MNNDATTQPMLEALLEGQRQLASQIAEMRAAIATISDKQDTLAAQLDALAAKQDALAAKQDELAARQDRLEVALVELTREVRDGFDDTNRKIDVLNNRLLTFETRLKRVDDRLHDEIVARTR